MCRVYERVSLSLSVVPLYLPHWRFGQRRNTGRSLLSGLRLSASGLSANPIFVARSGIGIRLGIGMTPNSSADYDPKHITIIDPLQCLLHGYFCVVTSSIGTLCVFFFSGFHRIRLRPHSEMIQPAKPQHRDPFRAVRSASAVDPFPFRRLHIAASRSTHIHRRR